MISEKGQARTQLSFRNSKIIYYGPHECPNCGEMVVRAGHEFGGSSFNQPSGPIYPNTEWHVHICDPLAVRRWSTQKHPLSTANPPQSDSYVKPFPAAGGSL